jgi:serine/threonine protein kinase/Tol biopolymer transport system component
VSLEDGETLGHYRIAGPLGKGGMGEVYVAEDTRLRRRVALKILPAVFAADPDRRKRFEREAQTIAALNHPGIVTIHSVEVDGPVPFLTMELVEGQLLRDAIRPGGLPLDAWLRIAIGMTDAVAAAHQRGIVHRDLKPANVIVCPDGRVKVLDFGLAKIYEADAASSGETSTHLPADDLTGEGRVVGTVAYMSPEQAEGKSLDQRSDIFALGAVLYEMATGDRPFKGDTGVSIISSIIKDTPSPVTDARPDLPAPLARIVKRCLIKDPQRRYQSARDLHADLEDLKQDVDSGVVSSPSGTRARDGAPSRTIHVSKPIAYTIAAALVALAAGAVWLAVAQRWNQPHVLALGDFDRLTDAGSIYSAAISPDGRYVVYSQQEGGLTGVWIRQTATTGAAQIVAPAAGQLNDLSFSPDGNFVYYALVPRDSQTGTLYRVSSLGGAVTRVLQDVNSNVAFSPDGRQFSFRRGRPAEGRTALMVASADGTGVRQIAASQPPRMFDDFPAQWSPDGRTIVAVQFAAGGTDIVGKGNLVSLDLDTGRLVPFGGEWIELSGVVWMPDGRSVVVAGADSPPPAHSQLWQVAWPEGTRRQLTSGLSDYNNVSISADGRTFAAIEDEFTSNIWIQPLAGGPGHQVTANLRGSVGSAGLAWTRDGRIVHATFDRSASPKLWVMDANGSHPKQLTTAAAGTPAASPDGKWIYYQSGIVASSIWRVPVDGGDPVQLTHGDEDTGPVPGADGKWLYFTSREGMQSRAMKVAADGGTVTPLTAPMMGLILSQLSADGSRLLGYATNTTTRRRQAVAVAVADGGVQFLEHLPSNGGPLPDGTAWLFTDSRDGAVGLFLRPIGGGDDRRLVDLGQDMALGRAVSPDGRTLAFVRGRDMSDVVLIKAK